eukprot:TRINITY_DN1430_c0_g2_i1.p2 TRINITY_DN1430_c0_g2~~TRINITY_DN1430_c0_g2_i1.p2  ORF type:complete len:171 (-),score=20.88 TRINITY_DN1430_c0_g2_i1:970-1482(-)
MDEWVYKPPPIFLPPNINIQIAITLQRLLEHGLTFQLPQGQAENPFLTSYEGILDLERNLPPLTHFTLNHRSENLYEKYENLLDTLRRQLKAEKLQILQADKGPGLLLIHNTTLSDLYTTYLNTNAHKVEAHEYNEVLRQLRVILYMMSINETNTNTDDRPPTMYFKIKT